MLKIDLYLRFDQLLSLGKTVSSSVSSQANESAVDDRMHQLTNERASLKDSWERRNKQLKQCSELQLFLRDAEIVDSATSAQEAFLANDDLGVRESANGEHPNFRQMDKNVLKSQANTQE
jgi:hypothetical protein